jgi:DNA-binding response OmpR family regulator
MSKILIVDDDVSLCGVVADWLKVQGYTVESFHTLADAEEYLRTYRYDLIVMDWNLPDGEGVDMVKTLRQRGVGTPILMLTGKTHIDEKEIGLDAGSDDYLTKPFALKELSARIRAMLRRPEQVLGNVIVRGKLNLDTATRMVTVEGQALKLYPRDFSLLEFLMRHPNQVFGAEALLNSVWSSDNEAGPDTVRTAVKRLRKQLEPVGLGNYVATVYGVGYKFVCEE